MDGGGGAFEYVVQDFGGGGGAGGASRRGSSHVVPIQSDVGNQESSVRPNVISSEYSVSAETGKALSIVHYEESLTISLYFIFFHKINTYVLTYFGSNLIGILSKR